jgi:hypothetical protein
MSRRVALVTTEVSEERRFLQDPHGITSQKTALFNMSTVSKHSQLYHNVSYVLTNK